MSNETNDDSMLVPLLVLCLLIVIAVGSCYGCVRCYGCVAGEAAQSFDEARSD